MKYSIEFKPRAVKEIATFPSRIQARILARIEEMSDTLSGDVKRLTDSTPEYRLRVGEYRVLFEKEGKKEYAVLPYEEFLKIQEELRNYEDLRCLREAKKAEKTAPTIGSDELKKQIGGQASRCSRRGKTRG
jgi:mRNA interferase RelE/StbE